MENKVVCNICNHSILECSLEEHIYSQEHLKRKSILIKELKLNEDSQNFVESVIDKWRK